MSSASVCSIRPRWRDAASARSPRCRERRSPPSPGRTQRPRRQRRSNRAVRTATASSPPTRPPTRFASASAPSSGSTATRSPPRFVTPPSRLTQPIFSIHSSHRSSIRWEPGGIRARSPPCTDVSPDRCCAGRWTPPSIRSVHRPHAPTSSWPHRWAKSTSSMRCSPRSPPRLRDGA